MAMTTRLLETGFDAKLHALQIIFVRMLVTATIGSLYLWRKKVPDFPLGPPGLRWLLVIRGLAGTLGLFGLYCKPVYHSTLGFRLSLIEPCHRLPILLGHCRCYRHHIFGSDFDWLCLLACIKGMLAASKENFWALHRQ